MPDRPSIAIYEQLRDRAKTEADEDGMTGPLIVVGNECWEPEDATYWAAIEAIENRRCSDDANDAAMIKLNWHRSQHEARESGDLRLKLVGPINAAIGDLLIAAADFDEEATDTAERLYLAAKECGIYVSGYDEQIAKAVEKLHSLDD